MVSEIILSSIRIEDFKEMVRQCVREEIGAVSSPNQIDDFIDEKEAAIFLMVSKCTLNLWRKNGTIPYHRIGTRIRYRKSELTAASQIKRKYQKRD